MTLNFIPDTIRKIVAGFTDKVLSRFKTNTPGNYSTANKLPMNLEKNQTYYKYKSNLKIT